MISSLRVCSSRVYTADLESALHYLLRVELATRHHLEGEELRIFKDLVTVVAKVTEVPSLLQKFTRAFLRTSGLRLSPPPPPPPLSVGGVGG